MTRAELHVEFNRLIDEYQSDYFTEDEVDGYLNNAQLSIFLRLMERGDSISRARRDVVFYESGKFEAEQIRELLHDFAVTTSDGLVTTAQVIASLTATGRTLFGIYNVVIDFGSGPQPVHLVTNSAFNMRSKLSLYQPTVCDPIGRIKNGTEYQFAPVQADAAVSGTAIVYPREMSVTQTDCDLSPGLKNAIAFEAVSLAGITIRSVGEIYQGFQNENVKANI